MAVWKTLKKKQYPQNQTRKNCNTCTPTRKILLNTFNIEHLQNRIYFQNKQTVNIVGVQYLYI